MSLSTSPIIQKIPTAVPEFESRESARGPALMPKNDAAFQLVTQSLENTPDFVMAHIFSMLFAQQAVGEGFKDFSNVRLVCRQWKNAATIFSVTYPRLFCVGALRPLCIGFVLSSGKKISDPDITIPSYLKNHPFFQDMLEEGDSKTRLIEGLQRSCAKELTPLKAQIIADTVSSRIISNIDDSLQPLKTNPFRKAAHFIASPLMQHKELCAAIVATEGNMLRFAPEEFCRDAAIVMAAVRNNGRALRFAAPELRDNFAIVQAATTSYGFAIREASKNLQRHPEIVKRAVSFLGNLLEYAPPELQDDEDIVMTAVTQNGSALRYASERLQDTFDIAITALLHCRKEFVVSTFQHCSRRLQENREIALTAIKCTLEAVSYLPGKFKDDKKFILEAVKLKDFGFSFISKRLKHDKEVVLAAIRAKNLQIYDLENFLPSQKDIIEILTAVSAF